MPRHRYLTDAQLERAEEEQFNYYEDEMRYRARQREQLGWNKSDEEADKEKDNEQTD